MSLKRTIGNGEPGRLVVSGGPLKPELLVTSEATMLGFYDRFGDLNVVLHRIFNDDTWGLVTKQDPDWKSILGKLGIEEGETILIPAPEEVKHVNDTRRI